MMTLGPGTLSKWSSTIGADFLISDPKGGVYNLYQKILLLLKCNNQPLFSATLKSVRKNVHRSTRFCN